jgi:hypothetical protein
MEGGRRALDGVPNMVSHAEGLAAAAATAALAPPKTAPMTAPNTARRGDESTFHIRSEEHSKESSASMAPETARPSDTPCSARTPSRAPSRARPPAAKMLRTAGLFRVHLIPAPSAPPTPRTPKLTKPTSLPTKPEPFRFDGGARDGALTSLSPRRTHCMRSPSIACGALHAEPEHCMRTHCMRSPSAQALAAWSADVLDAAAKRTSGSSPRAISHAISPAISHRSSPGSDRRSQLVNWLDHGSRLPYLPRSYAR